MVERFYDFIVRTSGVTGVHQQGRQGDVKIGRQFFQAFVVGCFVGLGGPFMDGGGGYADCSGQGGVSHFGGGGDDEFLVAFHFI